MDALETVNPLQSRQLDVGKYQAPRPVSETSVANFVDSMPKLDSAPADAEKAGKAEAMNKLQAMFISQMMSELFKEQTESTFGEGTQGSFYASVFADAVAEKLAERDLLHFGKMLNSK